LPHPPADPFPLYVWEVMGLHTTQPRRDAAIAALRRIPALTPDSVARAPRGKLESAVTLAGPYREERIRALEAGADAFRRHRDITDKLRSDFATATEALRLLPHLTSVGGGWLLLMAGNHSRMPADARVERVLGRLGSRIAAVETETGGVLSALQRAALYLAHHGQATCVETDPLCRICPLRSECDYATGVGQHQPAD